VANPEKEPKADDEKAQPAKKSKLPKIIILLVVLLVAAGGGVIVIKMMSGGGGRKKVTAPIAPTGGQAAFHVAKYKLDLQPFIVNLADPGGRRYLKVSIQLAFDESSLADEIKRRMAEFQDAIIVLLRSKRYEDIATPSGMIKLRNQLIQTINKRLPGPKVYTIHFTDFVVQ
jgi:flagellar FliL protein